MPHSEISKTSTTTANQTRPDLRPGNRGKAVPGLLLVWKPSGMVGSEMASVERRLDVGRSSSCGWCLRDDLLSRKHFSVFRRGESFFVEDQKSRNGLFVNGIQVEGSQVLEPGSVLRAGSCVFVAHDDLAALTPPASSHVNLMAGRFHTPPLIHRLRVAARTGRHVLLEGETGSGKELAAALIHELFCENGRTEDFLAHNAACFAGEDDAVGTLFGVSRGAFTGVSVRVGALEQIDGGTLFLDEVHNLPIRVQRSLLRFTEDGMLRPLGGHSNSAKSLDVRLVLGTNVDVEQACDVGQLAHDLVARLHRVTLEPLRNRRADIPAIFVHVLQRALGEETLGAVTAELDSLVMERLCLHEFRRGNVRELVDLSTVIGARIVEGEAPSDALSAALDDMLGSGAFENKESDGGWEDPHASSYERHRDEILSAYREVEGNISKLVALLKARDIPANRRWLAVYLERWGVRPIRRRK